MPANGPRLTTAGLRLDKILKLNLTVFIQEFAAKAGPAAEGADADDIKTCFELKQDQMICKFSVGGTPEMSVMYNYDGPCENEVSHSP